MTHLMSYIICDPFSCFSIMSASMTVISSSLKWAQMTIRQSSCECKFSISILVSVVRLNGGGRR